MCFWWSLNAIFAESSEFGCLKLTLERWNTQVKNNAHDCIGGMWLSLFKKHYYSHSWIGALRKNSSQPHRKANKLNLNEFVCAVFAFAYLSHQPNRILWVDLKREWWGYNIDEKIQINVVSNASAIYKNKSHWQNVRYSCSNPAGFGVFLHFKNVSNPTGKRAPTTRNWLIVTPVALIQQTTFI